MAGKNINGRLSRTDEKNENRRVEGIGIGAVSGSVVGLALVNSLGILGVAWGAGIGMVAGYFIGLNIKR